MTESEAIVRLEMLVSFDTDPTLDPSELYAILSAAKRADAAGNPTTNVATAPTWAASTAYNYGDVVTADPAAGRWWLCIAAGTSNDVQPNWPDMDRTPPFLYTVLDNEAMWAYAGRQWVPTWDINAAAAEGWRVKAGKASGRFNFTTDGQMFQRSQVMAHCREMERTFRRKITGGV